MASVQDPCSFASSSKCTTKHLNLSYHVDFERRVLKGTAALTLEVLQDRCSSLVQYRYAYIIIIIIITRFHSRNKLYNPHESV